MGTDTLNLPADLREALDRAVAAIVEIAHPELITLFGSWADGTAREIPLVNQTEAMVKRLSTIVERMNKSVNQFTV